MFIGRAQPEATSPFEGAESNLSFSTPEPVRSFQPLPTSAVLGPENQVAVPSPTTFPLLRPEAEGGCSSTYKHSTPTG
jgi:hypothetical protein